MNNYKNILLATSCVFSLFLVSFGANPLNAQNLQFSKAKLIGTTTDTVPTGKVWKVEGFIYSQPIVNCPINHVPANISDSILINSQQINIRAQRFSGLVLVNLGGWGYVTHSPEFIIWEQKTPLWLPSGTTLAASKGVLYINVLEFNTAP